MSRPTRNGLLVAVVLVAGVLLAPRLPDAVVWALAASAMTVVVLATTFTGDFRAARALFAAKKFDEAALRLAAFEKSLASPLRARLAGLAVGVYTSNALAAARNTLGAVRLEQGRFDEAQTHFDAALEMDAHYALPWANKALLAKRRGETFTEARNRAVALGAKAKVLDALLGAA